MTGFPTPDRRFSLGSPMPSSGLRTCARRLASSSQPNRVHFLRTVLSLPAALHLAFGRRSCFQLYTFHVSVERTFTSPIKCACTRTSAGGSPACIAIKNRCSCEMPAILKENRHRLWGGGAGEPPALPGNHPEIMTAYLRNATQGHKVIKIRRRLGGWRNVR